MGFWALLRGAPSVQRAAVTFCAEIERAFPSVRRSRPALNGIEPKAANGLRFPARPKGVPLLSFPPFRLDLADERLWKDGEELRVRRKPFAILKHFVKNPRRLVTHEELVEAVWGKIAMSESLVRTHVRDLRQALGDEIIETVVGRGYRFLADVTEGADAEAAAASAPGDAPASTASIVGRGAELESLEAALRGARERRRGVMFVTGDPGVGKTTLVDAFVDRARARSTLFIARGTCIEQYGSGEAYLPMMEAIGALCRARGGERVVDVLLRHAPTWLVQMPGLVAAERLDELHRRAAGAAQGRLLREIAEALEALSIDAPVVLTLDDLQWSDPSTIDLVAMLARRREPARLLVVASYRRSELPANGPLLRIADDLIAHRTALSLRLEPFDEAGLAVFLAQRFPQHAFPSELAATVHRATGGSPLFVATLVEDLLARGMIRETEKGWELTTDVAQVAAQRPDGVRRLIDMQIDRLGAAQQHILEAASVAGITFTAGAVAHALDAQVDDVDSTCETLAASHRFLQYVGTETWPDGTIHTRYAFEHALIQHAALARNPSASVRLWHRKIAERLEAGYAGREMDVASELAVHFEHGQRPAHAARYYVKAGERAARRFGNLEAVAHFERALALVATLPEGGERDGLELQASFALGQRLFPLRGGGAKTVLGRARDLAVRLGDETTLAGVLVRLQMSRAARGDIREAVEQAAEVARVVEKVGDANLRRLAKQIEVVVAVARGHLAEARTLLEDIGVYPWDARRRGAAIDEPFPAIGNAAIVSLFTGRPDEALALGRRMFEIGEATGNPFDLAAGLCEWACVFAWRGEPAQAEELSARSLAMAEEGSFAFFKNRAQSIVLWARAKLGTASAPMLEALCEIPWDGGEGGITLFAPLFADACWRVGLEERALEVIEKTLALAERSDERIAVPELYRVRGEILKAHDKAEAERAVKTAIDLARVQGSTFLEMRAHRSLYALATGATKKRARDEIARLLATFTEGLDTRDVLDARAIVGGV